VDTVSTVQEDRQLGPLGRTTVRIGLVVGLAAMAIALLLAYSTDGGMAHLCQSYLTNFCYFLSLALGALFFVVLQHLTRSGWSVAVRRLAEGVAGSVLLLVLLLVPIIICMQPLYTWVDPNLAASDHLLHGKQAYLNRGSFVARCAIYFVIWAFLARYYLKRSIEQDSSGDPSLTQAMERLSAPAMIVFALTITFAAFDLLMSRDPKWYSTIFGVYYYSGSVVGFFALLAIVMFLLQRSGRLTRSIRIEHYHDVGRLLFAFVVFWAYIAFSQYMLMWYANIPEETTWYLRRQTGSWTGVSLVLLFGHFVVPFLALVSRWPKRRPGVLAAAGAWMLVMHWIDVYWLTMPEVSPGQIGFSVFDVLCFVGIGAWFVAWSAHLLRDCPLIPSRDPRLPESLAFENA
jgi:hypothetical protein